MTDLDPRLDPELAQALATMPRNEQGGLLDLRDIPALREQLHAATAAGPQAAGKTVTATRSDGSVVTILLFRPAGDEPKPALLWFHAGGQVLGSAADDAAYCAALADTLECVVAAVDYRLAPETPAPGAAEDGYLAFAHLRDAGREYGIDVDRIGIGAASGGGAPATATALMIRDRGLAAPAALALLYPMLDDRNETHSSREVTDIGVWDRRENLQAWTAVLGERAGAADVHPYAAPARAEDVTGLPPTFVATAQWDVFRDEDVDLARRLIAAGVPTDLHVYAGAFHGWDRFAPGTDLANEVEQAFRRFLRRHL